MFMLLYFKENGFSTALPRTKLLNMRQTTSSLINHFIWTCATYLLWL